MALVPSILLGLSGYLQACDRNEGQMSAQEIQDVINKGIPEMILAACEELQSGRLGAEQTNALLQQIAQFKQEAIEKLKLAEAQK